MAKILADRDIARLIGTVLIDADREFINPNGIELRLGKHVHFHSTGEEAELQPGLFLKVNPGETVSIPSLEKIDFTAETVGMLFRDTMLMGFITPTTTMMREGISQVATKIDAGFTGNLNWSLRNGSIKELILRYGEPIFKLTIFALDKDESPDLAYGERPKDSYQGAEGIRRSTRSIPADIPKSKIVSSSFDRLDPKKQLKEAGYPFDHIGTELTTLHGKFEVVSTDVRMMKDEFNRRTTELSEKIASETITLASKLEETKERVLERVEALFDRKFLVVAGVIIGAIPLIYGGVCYLQGTGLGGNTVAFIAMVTGAAIMLGTYLLARRTK
jgi:deoxycytidine triphosphate deaminase